VHSACKSIHNQNLVFFGSNTHFSVWLPFICYIITEFLAEVPSLSEFKEGDPLEPRRRSMDSTIEGKSVTRMRGELYAIAVCFQKPSNFFPSSLVATLFWPFSILHFSFSQRFYLVFT